MSAPNQQAASIHPPRSTPLLTLPPELHLDIASYLPSPLPLSSTCRQLRRVLFTAPPSFLKLAASDCTSTSTSASASASASPTAWTMPRWRAVALARTFIPVYKGRPCRDCGSRRAASDSAAGRGAGDEKHGVRLMPYLPGEDGEDVKVEVDEGVVGAWVEGNVEVVGRGKLKLEGGGLVVESVKEADGWSPVEKERVVGTVGSVLGVWCEMWRFAETPYPPSEPIGVVDYAVLLGMGFGEVWRALGVVQCKMEVPHYQRPEGTCGRRDLGLQGEAARRALLWVACLWLTAYEAEGGEWGGPFMDGGCHVFNEENWAVVEEWVAGVERAVAGGRYWCLFAKYKVMGLLFMNRLNELSGMVAESAREVWMKWNSDERRARDSTLDGAFWGRITEIMEMLISDEMDDWENAQFVKLMVSSDGLIKVEEGYLRNMKGEGAKCALFRDSDLGDLGRKVNRWRSLNRRAQ